MTIRIRPENYSNTLKQISLQIKMNNLEEEWINEIVDDIWTQAQLETDETKQDEGVD